MSKSQGKTYGSSHKRNTGTSLDLDWVFDARVNRSAVERRTATLAGRRTVKKEWQAAWLLRAVTCIDLTTLAGDDTPGRVSAPVRQGQSSRCGRTCWKRWALPTRDVTVAAVCVYPSRVRDAVEALQGTDIPVASVATGFPAGTNPSAAAHGRD